MKILIITNLENECSIEDIWIANSFINDGHTVKLVNKYYDKSLEDEYDIFIKRYSWIEDIDDFSVGAEESDYETRILRKYSTSFLFKQEACRVHTMMVHYLLFATL